jgi:hypothetical protein
MLGLGTSSMSLGVEGLTLRFWQAELVAMVLRWLPEDVTVHNEDLEGLHIRVFFLHQPM